MSLILWVSLWVESSSSLCLRGLTVTQKSPTVNGRAGAATMQAQPVTLWPFSMVLCYRKAPVGMHPDIPRKSRCFQDDMPLLCVPFCCLVHEQYFSLNHSTHLSSVLALFFQPEFLCSPPSLLRCPLSSAPDFSATSEVFSEVVIVTTDRPWWGSFRTGALKAIIICVLGQNQEMFLVLSYTEPKNVKEEALAPNLASCNFSLLLLFLKAFEI